MRIAYHVMSAPPPVGLLFLAATPRGLRYCEFLDRRSIKSVIAAHADDAPGAEWVASLADLRPVTEELESYFCGLAREFTFPLDPVGSPFQLAVWEALRRIPFGEVRSYGEIAREIGQPKAARAVGLANNQNPLAVVVPCHRVVGSGGDLVGYGGGLHRKRWLLDHERRFAGARVRPGELTETLAPATARVVKPATPARPAAVMARPGRAPARRASAAGAAATRRPAAASAKGAATSRPKAAASPARRPSPGARKAVTRRGTSRSKRA